MGLFRRIKSGPGSAGDTYVIAGLGNPGKEYENTRHNMGFRTIDVLSSDIQAEIETLEAYKQSVIAEAVTKGLDKNVEMKDSGIEWVGEIPFKSIKQINQQEEIE